MGAATERIAAKLAERRQAAAKPEPVEEAEADHTDDEVEEVEAEVEDTADDELEDSDEAEAPVSIKDRAAARRAARNAKAEPEPKVQKAKAKTTPVKGKKPASPAQIAAREAFAARSRAKAAERAAETTPVQTPEQVRAKQSADRKAERAAAETEAAERNGVKRTGTSKPQVVQKASVKNAAKAQKADKKAEAAAAKAKAASAKKAAKPTSDTKAKVLALWAKGKTRQEIMAELGLTYPAVFYHTKNTPGTGNNAARGKIFVDTELDINGRKLRNGKTENVSRSEAMRRLYMAGYEIGEVAKEFGVMYQIAYTAIKPLLGSVEEADEEVEEE